MLQFWDLWWTSSIHLHGDLGPPTIFPGPFHRGKDTQIADASHAEESELSTAKSEACAGLVLSYCAEWAARPAISANELIANGLMRLKFGFACMQMMWLRVKTLYP